MSFGRQLGDLARGGVRFVNIVSDLRNIPPTKYGTLPIQPIQTLGGTAIGDGNGAVWYWDETSLAADDGTDVVLPAGHTGNGRYRRLTGALPLSGGTMTGSLVLAGSPTAGNEAATKTYVDGLTGDKLTQAQVDARVVGIGDPRYVNKTGDTMSGPLFPRHPNWSIYADSSSSYAQTAGSTVWHILASDPNSGLWNGNRISMHVVHTFGLSVDMTMEVGPAVFMFRQDGILYAPNGFISYSDQRIKENIQVIPNAIMKVEQLRGCTFDRKDAPPRLDGRAASNKRGAGVIAQDVQAVLPEAVHEINDTAGKFGDSSSPSAYNFPERTLGVDNNAIVALLIQTVKELSAKVKALEAKVH